MKKFAVPTREEVSAENQQIFDGLKQAVGFVPNLYATMAHSEHALGKYVAFQSAKTSLSNKEKEAVNLVVSEVNGCLYCKSAHTAIGKMNGFSDAEILNLRAGHSTNPKLDALVKLAKDIAENKGRAGQASLDAFYAAGYNDGSVVDVIWQVADKIAANYLHNLTQIPVDFPLAAPLEPTAV